MGKLCCARAPTLRFWRQAARHWLSAAKRFFRFPHSHCRLLRHLNLRLPISNSTEAVQLFMDRVRAIQPGFRITDSNATAITQICIRLDGIPLAIELAAARTKLLTAEHIAERLDDRFNLLATGSRTSLPRQQTLRAAIDWSYDLLSAQERLLYRRVCVFVGGFALEAVEAICAGEGLAQEQVLDRLSQLIAKSMVVADTQHGREARYRLSETIRQYGLEKLRESREADTIQHRHLDFFLKFAEEAEPELRGNQQLVWLNKLEAENDNLRAALAWSRMSETTLEAGLRLAGALWRFWWLRAQLSEGREWLTGMLSRAASSRSSSRAKVLLGAGNLTYYQGDYTAARTAYEEGLTICHQTGDKPGAANSLNGLGNVAFSQGDYASAQRFYEESLAIRRELGDDWSVANSLCNLSGLAQSEGNYAAALLLLQECLSINRKLGDRRGIAFVLNNLGNVMLAQSEQDRAHSLQDESLTLYLELGDKWGIAYALNSLGDCEHSQGNYDKAYLNYAASLKLLLALKDKNGLIRSLEGIAIIAAQIKQLERSVRLLGAAQSLRDQIGLIRTPAEQTQCNRNLADLRAQLDDDAIWRAMGGGKYDDA